MGRDYRKIVAWERSHLLTLAVYQHTKKFPADERFAMVSQLRRSAYSVPANIAEGSARDSKRDYLRFLYIALGSLKETEYFLLLARALVYLTDEQFENAAETVGAAFGALAGLIKAVQREAGFFGRSWALLLSGALLYAARRSMLP